MQIPSNDSPVETLHPDRGAARIYAAVFGKVVPDTIRDRFVHASAVLDRRTSDVQRALFDTTIDRIGDLEALELAARYTRRLPTLCDRFRLMVYITETDPGHQRYYVGSQTGFIRGIASIAGGGLKTAIKLIKGWFLLKRIGHV